MTAVSESADVRLSRLRVPAEDDLSPEMQELYAKYRRYYGYLPNWVQAFALSPNVIKRFTTYYESLLNPAHGHLPMVEREMIASIVSHQNHCTYCSLNHVGAYAKQCGDAQRAQRVAHNFREVDDLSARERAIATFASKLTAGGASISDADFDALRAVGLDDEEILEVMEIASWFNHSNRLATPLAILPDDQLFDFQRI
ncbi:MAG: peroxidase-related enzyme [Pseudonocardia sp.]